MKPILLIEDTRDLAQKYIAAFEGAGYAVHHVIDAPDAVRLLQQAPNGYLLVCCCLIVRGPYITAFDFVDAMRQNPATKNLLFLLLTYLPDDVESVEVYKVQRAKFNQLDEGRTMTALRYNTEDILATVPILLSNGQEEAEETRRDAP